MRDTGGLCRTSVIRRFRPTMSRWLGLSVNVVVSVGTRQPLTVTTENVCRVVPQGQER
jgi:hypothetical protein